jgi:hypothetical protein
MKKPKGVSLEEDLFERLDRQRELLKLKRLHHSLGPENLKLLLSDKTFREAVEKEKINVAKFEEII